MKNPALKVFSDNKTAAKFWFLLFIILIIGNLVQAAYLVTVMQRREQIVVIGDDKTVHIAVAKNYSEAEEEKKWSASMAARAIFDRNPAGFDNPDLLKQVFLKPAMAEIEDIFKKDKNLFETKKLHQKCEIAEYGFLDMGNGVIMANLRVVLHIIGSFGTKEIRHTKEVEAIFQLCKNPDIGNNGRLLYAVNHIEIKESKSK